MKQKIIYKENKHYLINNKIGIKEFVIIDYNNAGKD
jgi:hypothetical protein